MWARRSQSGDPPLAHPPSRRAHTQHTAHTSVQDAASPHVSPTACNVSPRYSRRRRRESTAWTAVPARARLLSHSWQHRAGAAVPPRHACAALSLQKCSYSTIPRCEVAPQYSPATAAQKRAQALTPAPHPGKATAAAARGALPHVRCRAVRRARLRSRLCSRSRAAPARQAARGRPARGALLQHLGRAPAGASGEVCAAGNTGPPRGAKLPARRCGRHAYTSVHTGRWCHPGTWNAHESRAMPQQRPRAAGATGQQQPAPDAPPRSGARGSCEGAAARAGGRKVSSNVYVGWKGR